MKNNLFHSFFVIEETVIFENFVLNYDAIK
jgi:hypothetical protein